MSEKIIDRTVHIAVPRLEVFRALMDPGMLSRWLFATVSMTPEAGSAFSFEWRDSAVPATAQGRILELIPDRRLVLSWFMEADEVTSTATFNLDDSPTGGTILQFTQTGLPQEPEWEPRFRAVSLEWDKVLLNLRFLLEERGEGKHLFYFRTQANFRAAAARVFAAWTSPMGLASWLAREAFVVAEEDGELTGVTLDTGKALSARFHRIEPDRHLRMTWSEAGVRGLMGVSFWPQANGVAVSLTLRSFAVLELERPFIQSLWERRFARLQDYLSRPPLPATHPDAADAGRPFTLARDLEAPPSRVWNALTDGALLRRWLVSWSDLEPAPGATFTHVWREYGEALGRIEEVQAGEHLRHTWDLSEMNAPTRVTWRILPDAREAATRCRLELEHSGWGEGEAWDRQREAHEAGWASYLALLDFYLRKGAGRERRSFHVRRKLPVSISRAVELFNTAAGLKSWIGSDAEIAAEPGGAFRLTLSGAGRDEAYTGKVVARHPSGDTAVEIESPQPAFLEWGFAPDGEGSRVGVQLSSFTASPEWLQSEHERWRSALDRLAAGE